MIYPNPQIYPELKTIFVHIPKTAGTSVERALLNGGNRSVGGHTTALGFRQEYPEIFDHYYKFSIIRDPVDRFLSAYFYLRQQRVHPALGNGWIHQCDTLAQCMRKIRDNPDIISPVVHFLPQYKFVCDLEHRIIVDSLYKFEELPTSWRNITTKIGLPYANLSKLNPSRRTEPLATVFDELILTVSELYRLDFDLFDYKLPSIIPVV